MDTMERDPPETPEEVAEVTGGDPDRIRRTAERMLEDSAE
jgi:hypothetical protein